MMETVTIGRKHKGVFKLYEVMPEVEAAMKGIDAKPWREAKAGEWCISDDGYVAEVIARYEFTPKNGGKTRTLMVLPYARAWTRQKHLSFIQRQRSGNYHEQGRKSWDEEEARLTRTKNVITAYVQMILGGSVDWEALGKMYRPDQKVPQATLRRLFKNERIKRMIEQELEDVLKRNGITQESVIKTYQRAIEVGEAKGDAAAMVRGNDRLAALVGLDVGGGSRRQLPPPSDGDLEAEAERLLQQAEAPRLMEGTSDADGR